METLNPKLEALLSSPEEFGKLVEAAKKIIAPEGTADNVNEASAQDNASSVSSSFLPGLNLNPKLVSAVTSAARTLNEREKRIDLLYAMKPLVKNKSGETIERAVTAMKLARAVRVVIGGLGGSEKLV